MSLEKSQENTHTYKQKAMGSGMKKWAIRPHFHKESISRRLVMVKKVWRTFFKLGLHTLTRLHYAKSFYRIKYLLMKHYALRVLEERLR